MLIVIGCQFIHRCWGKAYEMFHGVQDWLNNHLKYLSFPCVRAQGPSRGERTGSGPCIGVGQAPCCPLRTWKARWDEGCGRFIPTSHRRKWFKTTSQAASEESAFQSFFFSWTLSLCLNLSLAINTNSESKLKSVKDRTTGGRARLKHMRDLFIPVDALWSRLVCCLACFLMQKRKGKDSIFSEKFINLYFKI